MSRRVNFDKSAYHPGDDIDVDALRDPTPAPMARDCDNCRVRVAEKYEPVWDEFWCWICSRGAYPKYPVLCAWCKAIIGEASCENSHGMCAACLEKRYPEEDAA